MTTTNISMETALAVFEKHFNSTEEFVSSVEGTRGWWVSGNVPGFGYMAIAMELFKTYDRSSNPVLKPVYRAYNSLPNGSGETFSAILAEIGLMEEDILFQSHQLGWDIIL